MPDDFDPVAAVADGELRSRMLADQHRLLSEQETMYCLRIGPRAWHRLRKSGQLKPVRLGRVPYWRANEVLAYIRRLSPER